MTKISEKTRYIFNFSGNTVWLIILTKQWAEPFSFMNENNVFALVPESVFVLWYLYEFVQLYAQPPFGVLLYIFNHLVGVGATAGLQVFVLAVEVVPQAKVLPLVNDFQLVAVS